jgi:hypothetical protein
MEKKGIGDSDSVPVNLHIGEEGNRFQWPYKPATQYRLLSVLFAISFFLLNIKDIFST